MAMTITTPPERVALRSELMVSMDALRLLWDLDRRHLALRFDYRTVCVPQGFAVTATEGGAGRASAHAARRFRPAVVPLRTRRRVSPDRQRRLRPRAVTESTGRSWCPN